MRCNEQTAVRHRAQHPGSRLSSNAMNYFAWMVLGVLAGCGASRLSNVDGPTYLADVLVGMLGAVVGGMLCVALAGPSAQPFNVTSLFAAGLAALFALRGFHVLCPRTVQRVAKPSRRWH